jgi:hypothetical protein
MRAGVQELIGRDVIVRGYQTHDKTRDGGAYIANGRDIRFADGSNAFTPGSVSPPPAAAPAP